MSWLDNVMLALNAIRSNLLRTILTFLIIAFGIMALVGILTAVDGIKASLSSNFATMGANNFEIRKGGTGIQVGRRGKKPRTFTAITIDDALDFKERFDFPASTSISFICTSIATLKYKNEKSNPNIMVVGSDENYLTAGGFDIGSGRNFSEPEIQSGQYTAILGDGIATKLFKSPEKAIGNTISIDNKKYRVVGVLEKKGASSIFSSDNLVIIPLLNARMIYGKSTTSYVTTVTVKDSYDLEPAIAEAAGLMRNVRKLRHQEEDDFEISTSDKLSNILIDQSQYITTAATLIGFITLLGGAIGLMNIMLVSVTERTREIGITKALGATKRTILVQFLVEAMVICQIGGLLGIVLGILAGNGVSIAINGPFIIPWMWIITGIVICIIVGLVSGIYPALKAAEVDPIESLRYE